MKKLFFSVLLALLALSSAAQARPGLSVSNNESAALGRFASLREKGWSPSWLPGLYEWQRADTVTLNSTTVSTWPDKSGQGRDASQGTAGKQPTYQSANAGYSGFPSLTFVKANSTDLVTATTNLAQPGTVCAVAAYTGSAATQEQLWEGGNSTHRWVYLKGSNNHWESQSVSGTLDSANSTNTKQAHCVVYNSPSSAIYINSSAAAVVSGDSGSDSTNGFMLGAFAGGSNFIDATMVEFVVSNVVLDVYWRGRLFTYQGNLFGGSWN